MTKAAPLAAAHQLREAGRLDEAARAYRRVSLAQPRNPEPLHFLGHVLDRMGRFAEAEAAYRKVLALDPGAGASAAALGVLLLAEGRYAEGWPFFDARFAAARLSKPQLPYPEWKGEPLAGKRLLIWPEQGFGDQIQFARFVPVLRAQGADVTLICRPELTRLFQQSLDATVIGASGKVEFADPDHWVMICSLGRWLDVTLGRIPAAPYLTAPAAQPTARPRIGLVTRGSPTHANDAHRSLPADQAERLRRELPGEVVSLDPAQTGAKDFADTAALLQGLDLVVSVDTAPAHLAGAMGKPCWTLLPATDTDWRWLRERTDSPWYPSMRLYRQPGAGRWADVVDRVLTDAAAQFGP